MSLKLIFSSIICVFLISCGSGSSPVPEKQVLLLTYDFSESVQDFSIDTADHHVEHQLNAEIISKMSTLPSPYEYRQGIMFHWNNYSDDMKGFIKKKITELISNSQFQVDFKVNVLTFMSENCAGASGLPGPDVKVKAALLVKVPSNL